MKISSIASLAFFSAILGTGLFLGRNLTRARIPAPESLPAEAEGPPPRSTLLEKGDWFLARGDLDRAAAAFEEAAEFAPSIEEAKAGLREVGERKRQACLGNVDKLTELLGWLERHELGDEAEELARLLVKLDKSNAPAHRRLGHVEYEGEWYEKEQMDLVKAAQEKKGEKEAWERLSPRERLVQTLQSGLVDHFHGAPVFRDCAPEAPWLLACETSGAYLATERLDELERVLLALFAEFTKRFPGAFDMKRMSSEVALPVYVFRNSNRYRDLTKSPRSWISHFDAKEGLAYVSAAEMKTTESLLHEATLLLIFGIQRLNGLEKELAEGKSPVWISAGLACQFEAFRRDPDGSLVFEGVPKGYVASIQDWVRDPKRRRKIEDLLTETMSDYALIYNLRAAGKDVMEVDARFWSVVYFFINAGDGKYRKWFVESCVKEWREGKGWDRTALGSLEELDGEYREFILGLKE